MSTRSLHERMIQTFSYELGGLLLAAPIYAAAFGGTTGASITLMACLWLAELIWSPLHGIVFDRVDLALSGRVASDRPQAWRAVHAVSTEASSAVVTVPILMVLGGHSLLEALALDVGLTLLFMLYTLAFHNVFDRLRPVAPARAS